jgi:hypothetical protein
LTTDTKIIIFELTILLPRINPKEIIMEKDLIKTKSIPVLFIIVKTENNLDIQ